ncbi:MAG TPA: chemotaxis protein CheW [Polyangiaceae bacterium]|nr:chemotaxis protein CheW [Polyangiaceae bacterium]
MDAQVLPIKLDSQWFFVEAHHVREVLGAEPWLPIPRARAELPGVVVWRGRAVPLVDLARLLGMPGAGAEGRARTLIVHHDRGVAAVPVDAAREVRQIPEGALRPVHAAPIPYATRELDDNGEIVVMIDLGSLLTDLDRASGSNGDAGS